MDLKGVKESIPIELVEYAVANNIHKEPSFSWWVPYTLKKINIIIAKVNNKYCRMTHKYGVVLQNNPKDSLHIDQDTITDYLEKAINKEINKSKVLYKEV